MDIDKGDELFIYFYGTGEPYHRCRMLYVMRGPDSYDTGTDIHGEYWYNQRQNRNDYSDNTHLNSPTGGRYYFHFYAVGAAVGTFHANVSRDAPSVIHRFAHDTGTLWWTWIGDQNLNDVWKVWLVAGPTNVEGVEVKVTWPYTTHRVSIYAYDLVDGYEQNLLNLSYAFAGDQEEVLRFTASYTGWYYIRIYRTTGEGPIDYDLYTKEISAPNDGDNTVENATWIRKSGALVSSLEASRDMHDWFSVELVKGDTLGISVELMDPNNPAFNPGGANYYNFYEVQVYDPYMRKVRNGYDVNQGWPVPDTFIANLPIQPADIKVNGTYWIRTSFSTSYGYYYDATNTSGHFIAFCNYRIQITFPNRAPNVNATALEDVIMLEDTTWWENLAGHNVSGLDLNTVFADPEDGYLTFFAISDPNVTAKLVGDALTLKPKKDWNGEAVIGLRCEDDSGNSATASLNVLVVPVNDPPRSYVDHLDIAFDEDEEDQALRTLNLYDLFYDVDEDDAGNLTFEMLPSTEVTATINGTNGDIVLEALTDLHGEFVLTFRAVDAHLTSHSGEVNVAISPVNDAPRATEEKAWYTFAEGFMLESFDAAEHIFDPDGDTELIWTLEFTDANDMKNVTINNEGRDTANSQFIITPTEGKVDWFGNLDLVITCTDPGGLSSQKAFHLTVTNTPDAPNIAVWTPEHNPEFGEAETFTFTVTSVVDPDEATPSIMYSFRLKGPDDFLAEEVQNSTDATYLMTTDYEGEGEYILEVVVFDGDGLPSPSPLQWVVTVTKTNRAPTVDIDSPQDGEAFKEKTWIEFMATAFDLDVEDQGKLVIEWYEEGVRLGEGRTFSLRSLKPGSHEITVAVTDPDGLSTEGTVSIVIKKADDGPGPGALAALAALGILALASRVTSRRRT